MDKKLFFIDCDPGIDDAAAILLAGASPEVEVIGISAVAGNVPFQYTLANALALSAFAKLNAPVYAGADRPLRGEPLTAEFVHGANGLRGHTLPDHNLTVDPTPAWDALYAAAKAYPHKVTLVALGPLTNVAIAFAKWRDLPELLERVVIMGGATHTGNITPAAEFNFAADPEAAEMVLRSAADLYICPLDVTEKSYISKEELAQLDSQNSPQAKFFAAVMGDSVDHYKDDYGVEGAILHDPAAMLYALKPELFTAKRCWGAVETEGVYSRGRLVTDAFSDASENPTCTLIYNVDRPAFGQAILELMKAYQ